MEKAEKRKTGKPGKAPSLLGNFYRLKDGKCELARDNEEGDIFCRVYDLLLSGEIKEHVSIGMKDKLSDKEGFRPFTNKEHFAQVVNDLFNFDLLENKLKVKDFLKIKPHLNEKDCWTQLVAANKAKYDQYKFEQSLAVAATAATAARATDANSTPDTTKAKLAATEAKLAATQVERDIATAKKDFLEQSAARESQAHTQVTMDLADKLLAAQTEERKDFLKFQKEARAEDHAASQQNLGTFTNTLLKQSGMFANALGEQRNQLFSALAAKPYDQKSLTLQLLQGAEPTNQEGTSFALFVLYGQYVVVCSCL